MTVHDRAKHRARKCNPRVRKLDKGCRDIGRELRAEQMALPTPDPIASHVSSWAGALGAAATLRQREALEQIEADEALESAELAARGGRIVRTGAQGDQHRYEMPRLDVPTDDEAFLEAEREQLGVYRERETVKPWPR